jgi:hypothetical protein
LPAKLNLSAARNAAFFRHNDPLCVGNEALSVRNKLLRPGYDSLSAGNRSLRLRNDA